MQIVIDIPESTYKVFKQLNKIIGVLVYEKDILTLIKAVKNGTPLPKGHGALKDVDNIKTAFPSGEYVRTESVRATIDHEDTIVKADKGE